MSSSLQTRNSPYSYSFSKVLQYNFAKNKSNKLSHSKVYNANTGCYAAKKNKKSFKNNTIKAKTF